MKKERVSERDREQAGEKWRERARQGAKSDNKLSIEYENGAMATTVDN